MLAHNNYHDIELGIVHNINNENHNPCNNLYTNFNKKILSFFNLKNLVDEEIDTNNIDKEYNTKNCNNKLENINKEYIKKDSIDNKLNKMEIEITDEITDEITVEITDEITDEKKNNDYLVNDNIELDNLLCYYCIKGDLKNITYLLSIEKVDPFKFNVLYNTNPINLAYINNQKQITTLIKNYVYHNEIKYDVNFYCPSWELKEYNKGTINFQTRIFADKSNKIYDAFWSMELDKWIQF